MPPARHKPQRATYPHSQREPPQPHRAAAMPIGRTSRQSLIITVCSLYTPTRFARTPPRPGRRARATVGRGGASSRDAATSAHHTQQHITTSRFERAHAHPSSRHRRHNASARARGESCAARSWPPSAPAILYNSFECRRPLGVAPSASLAATARRPRPKCRAHMRAHMRHGHGVPRGSSRRRRGGRRAL